MENGLCRSRTTRWADVEDDDDDLDMSLPEERMQQTFGFSQTKSSSASSSNNVSSGSSAVTGNRSGSGGTGSNNNVGNSNSGSKKKQNVSKNGNSQTKQIPNLPKDPPYVAKMSNLDYTLQLKDIQDFFEKNGITNIKIKLPMRNGNNEGVATIEFVNFSDFLSTVCELDGACIKSRNVRVNHVPHPKGGRSDDNKSSNFRSGSNSRGSHNNANLNFARGCNGNFKSFCHSNRDLSPDFSIVRKMNNNTGSKTNDSLNTNSISSSEGGKPSSSNNAEENKPLQRFPNSKSSGPKNEGGGANFNSHTELGKNSPNTIGGVRGGKGNKGDNNNVNKGVSGNNKLDCSNKGDNNDNKSCDGTSNSCNTNNGNANSYANNCTQNHVSTGGKMNTNEGSDNSGNCDGMNGSTGGNGVKVNGKSIGDGGSSNSGKKWDSGIHKDKNRFNKQSAENGAQFKGQKGVNRGGGLGSNISRDAQSSKNGESADTRKGKNNQSGKSSGPSPSSKGSGNGNGFDHGKGAASGSKNNKPFTSGQRDVMKNGIETRNRFAALGD